MQIKHWPRRHTCHVGSFTCSIVDYLIGFHEAVPAFSPLSQNLTFFARFFQPTRNPNTAQMAPLSQQQPPDGNTITEEDRKQIDLIKVQLKAEQREAEEKEERLRTGKDWYQVRS